MLMPKLRFPEFRGAEGWGQKTLGSMGQLTRGLTYSSDDVTPSGLLVLRSTNIQDGGLVLDQDLVFVGKACPDALRLQRGDIAICMSNGSKALVGKSAEYSGAYDGDVTVGAFCSFFRPALPFAKLAFHLHTYQKYIADLIAGGNINNLTNSVLEEFSFPVPPTPAEQQKIAECLSSVDELIAAQARKVDALKTHKKGLMQQLFPREGETVPKLRFPEFRDGGEWEVKRLKHLATYTKGFAFKSQDYREEGIRIIRVSDLGADFIKSDNEKIFIDVKSARLHERYRLRNEEIIITTVGSKPELIDSAVGRGIRVTQPDEGLLNQNLLKLEVLPGTSSMFLFCNINTELYQKFIVSISRGNANQANIAVKELMDFEVAVPAFLEQQRIASCLASLDALITAETQKLEALKTHKKGLMQQLFPSPEEVKA